MLLPNIRKKLIERKVSVEESLRPCRPPYHTILPQRSQNHSLLQGAAHDPALPATPNLLHQLIPNNRQRRFELLRRLRPPLRGLRHGVAAGKSQVQHIVLRMSLIPIQSLIRETRLRERQASFARDLPTINIPIHAIHQLLAAHDGDDAERLDLPVLGRVELLAAVALGLAVVVAQHDEAVDVRVQVLDRAVGELADLVLERGLALPAAVALARLGPVAVDVHVGVAAGRVFEEDGAAAVVFAVVRVGVFLAGAVGDGDGVCAFSALFVGRGVLAVVSGL